MPSFPCACTGDNGQLSAALQKIRSHISSPKKFVKASVLLRQLLQSGSLNKIQHRPLVFAALCAAMEDTKRVRDEGMALTYEGFRCISVKAEFADV